MADVRALNDAMAGCGTNDDAVIRTMLNRTPAQLKAINDLFFKTYGKDLVETLKSDLTGDVEDAMVMLAEGQAKHDAQVLWEALDGIGTSEERMNEILCTRHQAQVDALEELYPALPENADGRSLWDDICGDTTFKYERFLKAMLNRAGYLAFVCWTAIHGSKYDATGITGLGTNEELLVRTLLSVNRDNDGIKGLLHTYPDPYNQGWREDLERFAHLPDIEDIVAAYPKLWELGFGVNEDGKTLRESIDGDTSWHFKDMLMMLITDKDESHATAIHNALNQTFVAKDTIMVIMASRSGAGRVAVAKKYKELYGVDLQDDLQEKMSDGEFNQVCRDMFQDQDEHNAVALFLGMFGSTHSSAESVDKSKKENVLEQFMESGMVAGWGTDEKRLSRVILCSSKGELKRVEEAYAKKFPGRNLMDDVYSETGGDYRRLLMYRFRRAKTGLCHVPRQKLIRCDDMPSNFPIDSIAKYDIL